MKGKFGESRPNHQTKIKISTSIKLICGTKISFIIKPHVLKVYAWTACCLGFKSPLGWDFFCIQVIYVIVKIVTLYWKS